ncbi:hypothetical protein [Cupriavidus nantongensis]|uniref:Uncharacterized protein n=1 Tax=Cupriavidus nantongensis TaxID=1796606 RepID=A0A142JIN9_9BURK|nr:hypothetical protein [Cupriavidus nantongensis]AMR77951.1 hypothetical protein A2G96_09470 [Cupriavidus nantongensis]
MNLKRAIAGGALVLAVALIGQFLGTMAGNADGERAKVRLEIVWPSLMSMPQEDRALLVGLAMSCRLERRQAEADEVVDCLRQAASSPDAMLPRGTDRASVPAQLNRLLAHQ